MLVFFYALDSNQDAHETTVRTVSCLQVKSHSDPVLQAEELAGGQNKEVSRWIQDSSNRLQAQKDREKKMYKAILLPPYPWTYKFCTHVEQGLKSGSKTL